MRGRRGLVDSSTRSRPTASPALWTFFPDPWPKQKHHKRRLVSEQFAALAASRLRPGAEWRLATDWAHYAEQMRTVLDAEPLLEGGRVERWAERPVTRFERKGLDVDRDIVDLCYRRVESGQQSAEHRPQRRQLAAHVVCGRRWCEPGGKHPRR